MNKIFLIFSTLVVLNAISSPITNADGKTNVLSFDYYSQANGLPNNQVQCIFQDRKGWIWIGTSQGLSRFDSYRFVNYVHNPEDTSSLSGNLVRVIFEDREGTLLVGTENGGLNVFDREKERFIHPYKNHPEFKSKEISVNTIVEDSCGNLYIGTDRSLLKIDKSGQLTRISPLTGTQTMNFTGSFVRVIQIDNSGNLWIGTTIGLFLYHPDSNLIEAFSLPLLNEQSSEIFEIFKDDDGLFWIGTYSNGLFILDPVTKSVRHLSLYPYYERTETIRTISKGIFGDYWIGTRGGLYVYSKTEGVTGFFRHDDRDGRSLSNNSVLDIFHDTRGETWIGTRGGLNLLAKSKQVFRNFSALPNDDHYLNSSIIYAFWIDTKNRIWVGTEDGGINIYDPAKGKFEYLMAKDKNANSISQNCIKAFLDDRKGNLWIGTFWGGIDVLNLKTGKIIHYQHSPDNQQSLSDNRVWALCLDDDGGIWVGTTYGIDRFDPETKSFIHFPKLAQNRQVNWISIDSDKNIWFGTLDEVIIYDPDNENIIRHNEHSRSFLEDSEKRFWIATPDKGIALYSKSEGVIKYFGEHDGLSNNQVLCILEDNNHYLWISTSNGLSKFDTKNEQFRNFTSRDGLRNDQFTYGAGYKADNGELLFGGIAGFNMFNPDDILTDDLHVPLVFTELKVFNRTVPIKDGKDAILTKSISETSHLTLNYDQNVFTLEFAALDFINSSSTLYSYYLEGFDKGWNEPSISRTTTYTNLNPGEYGLRVRRILPVSSVPNNEELVLNITILPPFWMSWWFRSVMILVIAVLIYSLIRFIINREKIKNELVFEKTKARNLHELDMLKLRLFTNISHEIRTPLTLILGPLEKLMSKKVPEEEVSSHLALVYRNTKQLDRLINQLLDFRKLETGNLKLELMQDDMVRLISEVVHSFQEYAKEKQITLKFHTLKKQLIAVFDPDKVETILNNLISNALKYTGEGGMISVHLSLVFAADDDSLNNHPEKQYIEISVKDNGKGISETNIEKIFTRFFRIDSKNESTGTGIGLSLVKELVKLHRGNIDVISKPDKGSKFTVHLPYETEIAGDISVMADEIISDKSHRTDNSDFTDDILEESSSQIMLIVEDNPDVRYFIRSHFDSVYTVFEAKNGQEGWDMAIKIIPDVIISDILMPDLDGNELCKRIKKDERTSHIPVLLLTALHSKEHEIEGLSSGADDYVTKPFDISVLQTKIENMLQVRRSLKEKYTREIILKPSNITIASPDEHFLQKAIKVVERNISNADLDIEQFATEVGVSRMQLYRKFNALTNMTVKEFIRSIRLKRAAQLLLDKKMNITEIAYAVGFKDLSHFRKCFHREYGMSASQYVRQNSIALKN